jgi:hypothetical protein
VRRCAKDLLLVLLLRAGHDSLPLLDVLAPKDTGEGLRIPAIGQPCNWRKLLAPGIARWRASR